MKLVNRKCPIKIYRKKNLEIKWTSLNRSMNNLKKFYGFCCIWILHLKLCFSGTVSYTYMFMEARGATLDSAKTMSSLWGTAGGINDPSQNKHTQGFVELKQGGDFRSSLVDTWGTDTPSSVTLELYNAQGDSLFFLIFDTSGTTGTSLDWFTAGRIIDSSHDLTEDIITVVVSDSYGFEYRLQRTASPDDVWFTIWHGPFLSTTKSTADYPVFLFSRNTTDPNLFTATPGRLALAYCYDDGLTSVTENYSSPEMRFEDCMICTSQTGGLLFVKNDECVCGIRAASTTISDLSQCNGTCGGNTNQFYCGSGNVYAAYHTSGTRSNEPNVPSISTSFFVDTFTVNIGVTEIQVDLSSVLQNTDYAYTSFVILENLVTTSATATMYYNVNGPCDSGAAKLLKNLDLTQALDIPIDNTIVDVGIIPARCIFFKFQGVTVPLSVRIHLFTPNDKFIQAPYLMIKAAIDTADTTPNGVGSTIGESVTTVPVQQTTTETVQQTTTETVQQTTVRMEQTTTPQTTSSVVTTKEETTPSIVTTRFTTSSFQVMSDTPVHDITDSTLETTTTKPFTTAQDATTESGLPLISTKTTSTPERTTQNIPNHSGSTEQNVCGSCVCNHVINMSIALTEEELQKLILIRQNLTVDKTNLSSFLRTKISAPDNRTSAVGIGAVGVVVLCFVFGGIVIIDITRFRSVFYNVNERKT